MSTPLSSVRHVVTLMLENRSFDHMLGYLYPGNVAPSGQAFDGLTGNESCPDAAGNPVPVYPLTPDTPHAYLMPGADPGEGYAATNAQMFGAQHPVAETAPAMRGFVTNYAAAIAQRQRAGWYVVPGTTASMIMGCYTPQTLPVLSALARGYAVSDRWFCSAPTMTLPNRAFVNAGTSQGHMDDVTKVFTVPSIFGSMSAAGVPWKIYGYDTPPLTRLDFPDTTRAPRENFGQFSDFTADAAAGTLPAYAFLEPSWGAAGNSQHPNYDVARGEALILATYRALRSGPAWASTLLIVTYDEHGGLYDHVPPPWGATPPDQSVGEFGFGFNRFGVRVPTVLASPLIEAGTVFRAPDSGPPLDHTSILATLELLFGLRPLTARDAVAPTVDAAMTRSTPRADDPLAGVTAPAPTPLPAALTALPAHLEQVQAELTARLTVDGDSPIEPPPGLSTATDYHRYIEQHTAAWEAARAGRAR